MTKLNRFLKSVKAGFIFTGLQVSIDLIILEYLKPLHPAWHWEGNFLQIWMRSIPSFIIFVILVDLLLEKQIKSSQR